MDQLKDLIRDYAEKGWMPTMIRIWQEKIERLRIIRSGRLHESFSSALKNEAEGQTITMKFARYGIYQALGTGRGYERGNGGDLEFLDKAYRQRHRLDEKRRVGPAWGGYVTSGQPRRPRDWYNKKLYMSVMALKEDLGRLTGEQAAMVICDALTDAGDALR